MTKKHSILRFCRSTAFLAFAGLVSASPLQLPGSQAFAKPKRSSSSSETATLSPEQANQIAVEAYTFLYPLISMELTRQVMTAPESAGKPSSGPMNAFTHMRAFPDANFRDVVRPNFDTLYSSAWLDLTQEPLVVSHGDTSGRYFLLPMLDMWTNVFAVPGKRTTGTKPKDFLVVPPGWNGQIPSGLTVIQATTPFVWIIGRTQTNGVSDYPTVHAIQNTYRISPLSQWGNTASEEPQTVTAAGALSTKSKADFDLTKSPVELVNTMPAEQYFSLGAELMSQHRPQVTDWSQMARLETIGLIPGKKFDYNKAPKVVRKALDRATKDGLAIMQKRAPSMAQVINGWQVNTESMGVYGINYLKRAIIAMVGLGANQSEDAIYPLAIADSKGQALTGDKNYVLRFEKNALPPVDGFWSLTMYDQDGFQVANALNRFAIGDRDGLVYGKDGSLEIYVQHTSPGTEKEANWLPSPPTGKLGLTMRLYAPQASALNGSWQPPAISEAGVPAIQ